MLVPAAGTALGGLGILAWRTRSPALLDVLAGFAAGVMLAASAFSLLVPALDRGAVWEVIVGFVVGGLAIAGLDARVPHAHERFDEGGRAAAPVASARRRSVLLLSAMTIHNVPEGLAVGVAFAAGGVELGVPIALAIALQNVPEGFVAAAPLIEGGVRRPVAAGVGAATGLVEPPAALLGFAALSLGSALLPAGMAFAAAAMIYVVVDELLPECFARGNERIATLSLLVGFTVMMTLDAGLG